MPDTAPDHRPVRELLDQLGMPVPPELLDLALTHRSYAYEKGGLPTNERMEFLGDSVLSLVVTEHLYLTHPDLSEGQLAKLRSAVVRATTLAEVARELDLGAVVYLGRGEESTGGRDKSSILADTMEAVIGAVYLAHGVESARTFVHYLFDDLMAEAATRGAGLDWKTSLQEIASLSSLGVPSYDITESGPDHAKSFEARVVLGDERFGPGAGRNKKEAEQNAASVAFEAVTARLKLTQAEAAPAAGDPSTDGVAAPAADPSTDGADTRAAGRAASTDPTVAGAGEVVVAD